jgi:hypothetical protein
MNGSTDVCIAGWRWIRDLNAARNILNRAGVGPGLHNVAGCGMRAGGNLGEPTPFRQTVEN